MSEHPAPGLFPPRIEAFQIQSALDRSPPGALLLVDYAPPALELRGGDVHDVRGDYLGVLDRAAEQRRPVVYAVDQDELGAAVVRALLDRRLRYLPAQRTRPVSWAYKDRAARAAIAAEHARQTAEGWAKFEPGTRDAENICQALRATERLPGAYLEIGCYLGSSGAVAVRYMAERGINRPAWFLDVFDGFTYEAARESVDALWADTHFTDGIEKVRERLSLHAEPEVGRPVHVVRSNVVTDDLPSEIEQVAVANIDVDLLEAVHAALIKTAPLIVPGGIMIAEDPGHTPALIGAQVAVDLFLEHPLAADFTPIYMESGQYFFVRRR